MTPGVDNRVLADSSVWIDHLRRGNDALGAGLDAGIVVMHEFVLGELMLGALARGRAAIADLESLARASRASHEEVATLVRAHRLEGVGIGWVDAHLLTSAVMDGMGILTLDKALMKAARRVGIAQ